jgi:putative phosphoribosyl transferase
VVDAVCDWPAAVVLALPRGGVPVAAAVADALHAPLDVFVVRKLGVPGHEELAMGAVASGGAVVLNDHVIDRLRISREEIDAVIARERDEVARREVAYRTGRPRPELARHTVVIVDDGLATGATMRAALVAVRDANPAHVIAAIPVASADSCRDLADVADAVVCVATPSPFVAVGQGYEDFSQVTDDEVTRLLSR